MPTCFWILVVSTPSSKDCKIQSLLCDKASGNSKGSKVHCAKNFSGSRKGFWEQQRQQDSLRQKFFCKIQSLLCDKVSGNSKGSKIYCAKKFLGAAKIARFSLYCAAKVARFIVPKNFLGAAKIARFSPYCATKLLGTAKLARCTVPKNFLGAAKILSLIHI